MQRKLLIIAISMALGGVGGMAGAAQADSYTSSAASDETAHSSAGSGEAAASSADASAAKEGMDELKVAAQRLRDSVHQMTGLPAGEQRTTAMRQARKALFDTQEALIAVAPKAAAPADGGTSTVEGAAGDDALDRLMQAAQRLRDTVQTLAEAPRGAKFDSTMDQAREALIETQTAMANLPNQ